MKRVGLLLACVAALALPAASSASTGSHSRLQVRLERAADRVAKYVATCKVSNPAATCAAQKAKLTAKFNRWDNKIKARIAKVSAKPDSARKTARLARLNDALTKIAALEAQL